MSASESESTFRSASRELGFTRHLAVAAAALVLAIVVIVITSQQDLDSMAFNIGAIAFALSLIVGLQFLVQAVRCWRGSQAVARRDGVAWAALCVQPENRFMIRLLIVDPAAGLVLSSLSGRQLAAWPWPDLGPAHVTTVEVAGRSKSGLVVDVSPLLQFAFVSPSGIGYSREIAERGMQAIKVHSGPAR